MGTRTLPAIPFLFPRIGLNFYFIRYTFGKGMCMANAIGRPDFNLEHDQHYDGDDN